MKLSDIMTAHLVMQNAKIATVKLLKTAQGAFNLINYLRLKKFALSRLTVPQGTGLMSTRTAGHAIHIAAIAMVGINSSVPHATQASSRLTRELGA